MRYCCDQALHEGRPLPTQPAKLPLMRPPYGRMGAGVCKAISMHLGIAVLWVRLSVRCGTDRLYFPVDGAARG